MSEELAATVTRDLEFGLFDWVDQAPGESPAAVYDGRLRLLAEADRGGFAVYHLAEHHGTPLGLAPSPGVLLAAAARETTRIRLAPTTFVVPLYDPLRLTEEIAMLDQLTHGRLEVGVGKGASPYELAMYGFTRSESGERFDLVMPAILEALETGVFSRPDGDGLAADPVPLSVPVYQRPHPPLWYPTINPESIARLGEQGYNVLFGFGFQSPGMDVVREQSRIYFERLATSVERGTARYSLPGVVPRFGLMRHVFVAPTDAEAQALARPAFAAHYESFTYLWRKMGSDRYAEGVDFDGLLGHGKLYVGSPQTVASMVAEAVTEGGVNYVAGSFTWGSLDSEASLQSLRLFRDEVIPAVRQTTSGRVPRVPAVRR